MARLAVERHTRTIQKLGDIRAERAARAIDRAREVMAKVGRLRLRDYIPLAWHVLEPKSKFKGNWHIDAIGDHLEAVEAAEIIRLAISMPPGCMKSLECSVFFPTHIWGPGGNPSARFLGFSHDRQLSTRDAVKSRRLIESDWYQTLWGDRFSFTGDQNQKTRYDNDQTGFRIADYVGGGTGERGDFITIDDPHEVADALTFGTDLRQLERASFWLHETLPSRVNDPETSAIVCIHHRIHQKDMIGDIMKSNMGYEYLVLPMEYEPVRCSYSKVEKDGVHPERRKRITSQQVWLKDEATAEKLGVVEEYKAAKFETVYKQDPRTEENELLFPDRFPRHIVDRDKAAMTQFAVNGQFQQNPTPREGTMIKRAWFEIVAAAPADCRWVRHWDLAATKGQGAYTAGLLLGYSPSMRTYFMGDCKRDRLSGQDVRKIIRQTAALDMMRYGRKNYTISLPQDPGQAGKVQAQDMVGMLAGYNVVCAIESGDKQMRAQPFADQAEAGNVKMVAGPWNETWLAEAATFPSGNYKDQIDAASGAFGTLVLSPGRGRAVVAAVAGHS